MPISSSQIWLRSSSSPPKLVASVREFLSRSGIVVSPDNTDADHHGILCCEGADSASLGLLRQLRAAGRAHVIAVTSGVIEPSSTWQLLRAGACDVFAWQPSADRHPGHEIVRKLERLRDVDELTDTVMHQQAMLGASACWLALVRRVVETARFSDAPILLMGESGTGKELLARATHFAKKPDRGRASGELIVVDCGALVPELSGSEFFGHERGAFTGAQMSREGAFAMANGGTLLLDEIGELPAALQAQLLRVLQEKTYKRVGGNVWHTTNFRLVCATNRDLKQLVENGAFRLDLYHRVAGAVFRTPPLRERRDDILALATNFLGNFLSRDEVDLEPCVREHLVSRDYPGNVRELRQLMHRIATRHTGEGPITAGDIPEEDRPSPEAEKAWPDTAFQTSISAALLGGATLQEIRQGAVDVAIRLTLDWESGNLRRAAKRLGVTDRALQMRKATAGRSKDPGLLGAGL